VLHQFGVSFDLNRSCAKQFRDIRRALSTWHVLTELPIL